MNSWATYKRLFHYVHRYWYIFLLAVIGSIGYSAVDAWLIKFLQPLIDDGLVARDDWFIRLIPIILPVAFLIRGIMSFTSDYSMSWLARHVVTVMRQEIFAHMQHLPASFYDSQTSGTLIAKIIYNTDQVARAALRHFENLRRGIPEREFNGPVVGLQEIYRQGLADLGTEFCDRTPVEQDGLLRDHPEFTAVLYGHVCEGMYGAPEYGGNRDGSAWRAIGFDGDVQPRGWTDAEVSRP